jgi:hypothetical protein
LSVSGLATAGVNPIGAVGGALLAAAAPLGSAADEAEVRATPQRGQNAKSASHEKPHSEQGSGCRRPHRGQKLKLGDSSKPQPMHAIKIVRQIFVGRAYHSVKYVFQRKPEFGPIQPEICAQRNGSFA